jgi:hypothetical protein
VGNDMGMGCAIQSYNQKIVFGITSDYAAAPDAHHMREFLYESFDELRRAAGLPEAQKHVTPVPRKRKPRAAETQEAKPAAVASS